MKRFLAVRAVFNKAAAAIFLSIAICISPVRAEFVLSPLRQVITEDAPVASFTVLNPSDRILEGRVTWIDLTATQTGYTAARPEDRAALSAAPFLTVSPAQFRLEPGAQTIISVRLREHMSVPETERRSHLLIEVAAARTPIRKTKQGGIELDIGLGVSAPVILRGPRGKARASIEETKLLRNSQGSLELQAMIQSHGVYSSYGRLTALMQPAESGAPSLVLAERRNIAGYLDAPMRQVTLPLNLAVLPPGKLELRYEGEAEFEGELFARRIFTVAPPEPPPPEELPPEH